jgi:flagellar biosynthetic protein FliR
MPLPWEVAPRQVKAAMVLFVTLVVHGHHSTGFTLGEPIIAAVQILVEFLAGAAMGFVVRTTIGAAEIAGSTIAPVIGFGAAQVFDPATGQSDSVLTRVFRLMMVLIALSVGLHRVVLGVLLSSFGAVPIGTIAHPEAGAFFFIDLSARMLMAGVRLALPVVAVALMCQVALAFVSRAAPTMQIFNVGFALLLAVGAVVMVLVMPETGQEMLSLLSHTPRQVEGVLMDMAGL